MTPQTAETETIETTARRPSGPDRASGAGLASGPDLAAGVTVAGARPASPRLSAASHARVHALQRLAGNRAVAASLQRDAPSQPLDEREPETSDATDAAVSMPGPAASFDPGMSLDPGAASASGGTPTDPATSTGPASSSAASEGPATSGDPGAGPVASVEPVTLPAPEPVPAAPVVPEPTASGPEELGLVPADAGPAAGVPLDGPAATLDGGGGDGGGSGGGGGGNGGAGGTGGTGGGPATVSPPFDFTGWVVDNGNYIRTPLEFGRAVPGLGLYGGLAADALQFAQDVRATPGAMTEHPIFSVFLMVRNGINMLNGAVGHVVYINELVQDGLAVSVIGAEFIPVSASAHGVFALAKAYFSTVLTFLDTGLMVGAAYNADHNPDQQEAWASLADGYAANSMGSAVSMVLDIIALASAGVSQTGIVSANRGALAILARMAKNWGKTLFDWAQQMFNVWGGDLLTERRTSGQAAGPSVQQEADPLQRLSAGDLGDVALAPAMLAQAANLRATSAAGRVAWAGIDAELAAVSEASAQSLASMDRVSAELFDGKSSFEVLRGASDTALAAMEERIAALQQFQQAARDGRTNADAVQAGSAEILTAIDGLTVPTVEIPRAELGDGALADLAEGVLNTGAGVAGYALEAMVARVRAATDTAKGAVRAPVESVRDNAAEIGEFLALAAEMTEGQVAQVQEFVSGFRAAMAQTTGYESAMDTIIAQVAELTGLPAFRIQDVRDAWNGIPGVLDDVDRLADRLEQRAAATLAGTPDAAGGDHRMSSAAPADPGEDAQG